MVGLGDPLSLAFGVVGALFACHLLAQPEPQLQVVQVRQQAPRRRARVERMGGRPNRARRQAPEWLAPLLDDEEWPDFRSAGRNEWPDFRTVRTPTAPPPASATAQAPAPKETLFGADPAGRRKNHTGVAIRNGRIRIDDWSAWMSFGPETMDLALDAGAKTSGDVLKVLLKRALPEYPWPPRAGSQFEEQWEKLAETVAETLGIPDLPPSGGGGEEEEEARPKLRLVQ